MQNKEKLFELHRRYIWALEIKKQYEKAFSGKVPKEPSDFFISLAGIYMSLWYSLLFVVLEGFKEKKIPWPAEIEKDV